MDFQTIIYEKKGRIGYITLNRPQAHNTINSTMNRELEAAWEDFVQDDDMWVGVVTGAGDRAFCVGMDLGDPGMGFGSQPATPPEHRWTAREAGSYKPVVTAVNGMCCAAGFYFINDSAITIASEKDTFFDPHVDIGFVAGNSLAAMSHFLPVGPVLRMFLMGRSERMSAQRAYEIGLVTEVVSLSGLRDRASEIAETLASKAPLGTRATLEVVWQGMNMGLGAAIEHSHQISMDQRRFEDFYEGIRAFNEKRQPRWQAK